MILNQVALGNWICGNYLKMEHVQTPRSLLILSQLNWILYCYSIIRNFVHLFFFSSHSLGAFGNVKSKKTFKHLIYDDLCVLQARI